MSSANLGISESSRRIKKDMKKKNKSLSLMKTNADQSNVEAGSLEEGEEDMNGNKGIFGELLEFDIDDKPSETLID